MKSKKSEIEQRIERILKVGEETLDDSHLTTKEGRIILDAGWKARYKCEELRISRDNHATKCQELRKQRDSRVNDTKLKQLMVKSLKMGQKKYKATDMPIRLWVAGEIEKLKGPKKNAIKK